MSKQFPPTFRLATWFSDLSEVQLDQLFAHYEFILKENKLLNFVSLKSVPFVDVLCFADSIMASRIIHNSQNISHIHDFGSGAGFPGVVYGILYPKTKVTLVEADKRRAEFLEKLILRLSLSNFEVVHSKIEKLSKSSVSHAVSRDFGTLTNNLITTRRLFSKNGCYFHLKGESWGLELSQIPVQVCSYWSPSLLGEYKLPLGDFKLSVIQTLKTQD